MTVAIPEHNGTVAVAGRPLDDWIPVLAAVVELAEQIADSPFVPNGLRGSIPAVAAAILAGRELDIPPMTALANIHVISGKTGLSALLMRGLIQSRGHEWEDVEVTDTRVVVRGRRKGKAEWTTASFNAQQAAAAKIALQPYPQDKLYARASVRLARRIFADVIMGMPYSAEELEDGDLGEQTETTPPPAEKPQPRTAQRRTTKTPAAQPADSSGRSGEPATPPTAPQVPHLPPLPGEDEVDYDTPGTVTPEQLTALWATFSSDLGFKDSEKIQARKTVEQIIGRTLDGATTLDLARNEASAAIDTLKRCKTRGNLVALLATGEIPEED